MSDLCPSCRRPPARADTPPEVVEEALDLFRVKCQRCGIFKITNEATYAVEDHPSWCLPGYLRSRHERGEPVVTVTLPPVGKHGPQITPRDAVARCPQSVLAKRDALLVTLTHITRPAAMFKTDGEADFPLAYAQDREEYLWQLNFLKGEGLLEQRPEILVTPRGWERAEMLRRGDVENPRQGFIALWFDDSMVEALEKGLKRGIIEAGFDPLVISDKEHNNDIMDEIIAEIRKSRFVVADFTGNRGGVYYEAGYAKALGKEVIFTCREDRFRKDPEDEDCGVHFDTEHQNFILWSDPDELKVKLRARIEATVSP